MLDIVINNKTYKYVNSAKIDDNSYIAYTDGVDVFISEFYYENDKIVIKKIDDETFIAVKEIMGE